MGIGFMIGQLIALVGVFGISALSIFLGYKLFIAGATGAFKFSARSGRSGVGLESVAPGLLFALFGALIALMAIYSSTRHHDNSQLDKLLKNITPTTDKEVLESKDGK